MPRKKYFFWKAKPDPWAGGQSYNPPEVPVVTEVDWLIDFAGSVGALVTPTIMEDSTIGASVGGWGYDTINPTIHTRLAATSVVRRTPLRVGGVDYSAATRLFKFDFDEAKPRGDPYEGLKVPFTIGTYDDYSVTALVQFNGVPGTSVNNDYFLIASSGWAVAQHQIGFDTSILCAHGNHDGGASDLGMTIPTVPGVWYSMTLRHNSTDHRTEVCLIDNDTGELVGCSECDCYGENVVYANVRDYLGIPDAGNTLIALYAGDSAGKFPLEPVTVPQPTGVTAEQTGAGELTLEWFGKVSRWRLERSDNDGASWETKTALLTGQFQAGYVDTDVDDTETYIYRITALMGDDLESIPLVTDPVTIDDAAFAHGTWGGAFSVTFDTGYGSGEKGCEILIGASDVIVTELGCWFCGGGNETYADVVVKIRTNASTIVASGTVLRAGATLAAYNYVALGSPYTMLAGQTYFLVRDSTGSNGIPFAGTRAVNSSLATVVRAVDETCTDPGSDPALGGMNFKY